jgi:hypothetical protein
VTGRHYQWHRNWTLDAANSAAAHASGLRVRYEVAADGEKPSGAICRDDGATCWIIARVYPGTEEEIALWAEDQAISGVRGEAALRQRLVRLMREAGDLWVYHQQKCRYDEKKA